MGQGSPHVEARAQGSDAWRQLALFAVFAAIVFLVTFAFFTRVCPLVPSDADDWELMAKVRTGLPEWGGFNPAKVLPETSLHFVSYLAAFCVMPFVGDYVWSLVVAAAILLSAFVTGYVVAFAKLLKARLGLENGATVLVSTVFYLAHFVLLSHANGGTIPYLLGTRDYTGVFHYTIPYVLCATMVLVLMRRGGGMAPRAEYRESTFGLSMLVLGLYLGMCSNLFLNIVLAAFAGASLVASLAQIGVAKRVRWTVGSFIRQNALHFLVLGLWVVTLLFERSGARASGTLSGQGGPSFHIGVVLSDLAATLAYLNRSLLVLFAAVAAVALVLVLRSPRGAHAGADDGVAGSAARVTFVLLFAWLLTTAFVVLLSSVMDPFTQWIPPVHYYASRPDVVVTSLFPWITLGCLAFAFVMKHVRLVSLVAPILVFVMVVSAVNGVGSYEQPVRGGISSGQTLASARDMVAQVQAADAAGQTSVDVHVLAFHNDVAYNWPLSPSLADGFSRSLYAAGITSKKMSVNIVPDTAVNARLGLPDDIGGSAATQTGTS